MNDKFFSLPEEKQLAIINAGYRVFSQNSYKKSPMSEIAAEAGISRQGVHDLIKRCDKILQDYESKLHLVEKFMGAKEKIREIEQLTQANDSVEMQRIRELSKELMKEW